jgi:hypothetical protein
MLVPWSGVRAERSRPVALVQGLTMCIHALQPLLQGGGHVTPMVHQLPALAAFRRMRHAWMPQGPGMAGSSRPDGNTPHTPGARPSSTHTTRWSPTEPLADAPAIGVVAALQLCRVASGTRDVAKVMASKTSVLPTLLAVLRDRTTGMYRTSRWEKIAVRTAVPADGTDNQ